jgi:hypothetical protein
MCQWIIAPLNMNIFLCMLMTLCHWQTATAVFDSIIQEHGFKKIGVDTPSYQLGDDLYQDYDRTLAQEAHSYELAKATSPETNARIYSVPTINKKSLISILLISLMTFELCIIYLSV